MTEPFLPRGLCDINGDFGMGSHTIDSYNVQQCITPDSHVQNEGAIGVGLSKVLAERLDGFHDQ